MFSKIGPGEITIIVLVLLLLFGARRLPELAKSIRESATELRRGFGENVADDDGDKVDEAEPREAGSREVDT